MTTDDTVTNGTADPKKDESAPAEKVSNGESAAEKTSDPPKEAAPKKSKKGKKGKKGSASTENGESKAEPSADGEKSEEKKEEPSADGDKKKPIKMKIPHWATVSDKAAAKASSKAGPTGATGISVIIDAIKNCANAKGMASYILIKKYVQKHHPNWPKMTFKSALRRSVDKGRVKKIKDSYKILSEAPVTKKAPTVNVSKKVSKGRSKTVAVAKEGPLEDLFPHIFTWVCEPKEASYGLIRKYIAKHYPKLSSDAPFKKALLNMVAKGQLDQITGKGANGTFQLENGAKKTGTVYEDPIEDAIIASNEPKDASITALRHYLSEFHKEYNVADRPKVLKNAIERAEAKGWLVRVTGKGFSGTFRLNYPYIPSPKDLWREDYVDPDAEKPKKPEKKRKKVQNSSDEESSSESESEEESEDESGSEEEEAEVIPKKKKRGAPAARSAAPAKKAKVVKKKVPVVAKKSTPKKKPAAATKKPAPKKKPAAKANKKSKPAASGSRKSKRK